MPELLLHRFYEHEETRMIKCGECWASDIENTNAGKYTGDESVKFWDLRILPEYEPFQCDECLEQNDAYDDMDMED